MRVNELGELIIPRVPLGGLGNRLFTYNFALQLSRKTGRNLTFGFRERNFVFCCDRSFLAKFNSNLTHKFSIDDINQNLNEVVEKISSTPSKSYSFPRNILGSSFGDITEFCPKELFNYTPKYFKHKDNLVPLTSVALHFRGGDFKTWDPAAILSVEYYVKAIEYISESINFASMEIYIVTDDITLPAISKIFSLFRSKFEIFLPSVPRTAREDFDIMATCDFLVSSPSTFCIWSGIVNSDAKIIHSSDWLARKISTGDRFWVDLAEKPSLFYRVWKWC